MPMRGEELQQGVQAFIRHFGLLRQDQTPCGRPLPTSQAHALQVLGQHAELTQQALAVHLHLDKSTTSRVVSQLVERGWVARGMNPQDRREACLTLTPQGREALRQVAAAAAVRYEALCRSLPPEKHPQVLEALRLLTEAVKELDS